MGSDNEYKNNAANSIMLKKSRNAYVNNVYKSTNNDKTDSFVDNTDIKTPNDLVVKRIADEINNLQTNNNPSILEFIGSMVDVKI